MKKKLAILLAILLCLSATGLAACASSTRAKVGDVPDSSYAVMGNGGMSVQQGEYVYFINGYADAADESGNTNKENAVIRGGIYRAKLADVGDQKMKTLTSTAKAEEYGDADKFADPYMGYYGTYKTVQASEASPVQNGDAEDKSGFVMNVVKDYEDKEIAQMKVEPIVNKKVTTGGDSNGGLFIYDGWIYFTTPVNRKNNKGEVQYNLIDFMRARLDGSGLETVYTSNNATTKPTYGYYKYRGTTYLVVYDVSTADGTAKNVLYGIPCGGKKIGKRVTIATDVATAMFAKKPVYYAGMPDDGVEDFVYYTRAPKQEDSVATGNFLCRVRPDGTQGAEIKSTTNTVTPLDAKNGLLFFTETTKEGGTVLKATDMMGAALEADSATRPTVATTEYILSADAKNLTNIFVNAEIQACRTGIDNPNGTSRKVSATPYAIATYNSNTVKITGKNAEIKVLFNGAAIVQSMVNNNEFLYVTSAEGGVPVYKANIVDAGQSGLQVTQQNAVIKDFFAVDVSAGYLFYVSDKVTIVTESTVEEDEDEEKPPVDPDTEVEKTYVTIGNYVLVRRVSDYTGEAEWIAAAIDSKDIPDKTKPETDSTT